MKFAMIIFNKKILILLIAVLFFSGSLFIFKEIRGNSLIRDTISIAIPEGKKVDLDNIEIKGPVTEFRFLKDGYDFSRLDLIINKIIKPGMTEREKAEALWQFGMKYFTHGEPTWEEGQLTVDPVVLLNSYGYGFCDDSATLMQALWNKAGLKTRWWGGNGHVVTEVYYEGKWHLYDGDARAYYYLDDGKTVAGVEDLFKNPDILKQRLGPDGRLPNGVPFKTMRSVFEAPEKNITSQKLTYDEKFIGVLNLKSNEIINYNFKYKKLEAIRPYNREMTDYKPPVFGGGVITYFPTTKEIISDAVDKANLKRGLFSKIVRPIEARKESYVTLSLGSHYSLRKAYVYGTFLKMNPSDTLKIFTSTNGGKTWVQEWVSNETGEKKFEIDLSNLNSTQSAAVAHQYLLKIVMLTNGSVQDIGIKELKVESYFQFNPLIIPYLTAGKNRIDVLYRGKKPEIKFNYALE